MTHLLFVLLSVEELGDLDLDIAKVSFTRNSFPLLFVWVCRLLRARRAALQSAVPIV